MRSVHTPDIMTSLYVINELGSIGPSEIDDLRQCRLKLLFKYSRQYPSVIPVHPAAVFGSLFHKILELGNKGQITEENFEECWEKLAAQMAQEYLSRGLNTAFQPIKYYIPYYAVKLALARNLIKNIASSHHYVGNKKINSYKNVEEPLKYEFLKGRPDIIIFSQNKCLVKDYKSGTIYNYVQGKKSIKPQYIDQLKAYGLLVWKNHFVSPENIELSLVTSSGTETLPIRFTEEEYSLYFKELYDLFKEANILIGQKSYEDLAIPTTSNCQYCPYRPFCSPFKEKVTNGEFINMGAFVVNTFELLRMTKWFNLRFVQTGNIYEFSKIPISFYNEFLEFKKEGKPILIVNTKYNEEHKAFYWTDYSKFFTT